MTATFALALMAVLALLLTGAAVSDIRSRTISNRLNLTIALLAVPYWAAAGLSLWPDVALQIGVAVLVFGVFAAAFSIGAMGGGDVKMIGAVALWLPWQGVLTLLFIMSLAGGALTIVMLAHKAIVKSSGRIEVPYGVAIAFGGLWLISERFFYHFGG